MKNEACAEQPTACSVQAKNPSRDLPIAILGSLSVATILYILMALAITLMVRALPSAVCRGPQLCIITQDCDILDKPPEWLDS